MKPGDLVEVVPVLCNDKLEKCPCWFCLTGNTKVGTVIGKHQTGSFPSEYDVLFGGEIYTIYENEVRIISEGR